ncbi:MAG: transcriptional regulator [Nocardia sp.]|uniref:MmyB family transcriptional regulator n=1 Tax=Nocardia sp. TaxID=1821 RepID=UPI0026277E3E|nr:hypothetical protein [Nocardia sp.]MCU1642070.1 transcriptional regulator [Nocardia sp.]
MLRRLLDSFPATPAFILNPALDLLAVNALADSLFSPFERADNLARMTFLDPVGRHFFARWEEAAESVAAGLRRAIGIDPRDRRAVELADTLVAADADFADLWNSHIVRGKTFATKDLRHPDVGALTLAYHCFDVRGASGQELVVYHAEPGSPSVAALSLLGALGATRRQAAPSPEKFRPDNSGVTER